MVKERVASCRSKTDRLRVAARSAARGLTGKSRAVGDEGGGVRFEHVGGRQELKTRGEGGSGGKRKLSPEPEPDYAD